MCLGSSGGEPVLVNGCTVAQQCVCGAAWKNHGAYLQCIGRASESLRARGLLSTTERDRYVTGAAGSSCGK